MLLSAPEAGTRRRWQSIDIFWPQGTQQQTSRPPLLLPIDGTDGRTDKLTIDRFIHPAPHADSVNNKAIVKSSPYSITERGIPLLIPVLGNQPAGDVSHKPEGRLPLLSARPAVIPATLKRAATNFAARWTEAQ